MSADSPAKAQDKFVLRLPDGMRDRLKVEADNNKRSMNAEIVDRLEKSLTGVERIRRSVFIGGRPVEMDEEFVETMISAFERARTRHDAKYGEVPMEDRQPAQFPLRADQEYRLDDLSDAELGARLERLRDETARLEMAAAERAKSEGKK